MVVKNINVHILKEKHLILGIKSCNALHSVPKQINQVVSMLKIKSNLDVKVF